MNRTDSPPFTQQAAQKLWADYMQEVEGLCRLLDSRQKDDIQSELKAHLLESYIQLDSGDEAERISKAITRLGRPRDFVPSWVEERLLDGAQPGSSARNLFHLLRSNAAKGIQQFLFSLLIGFGYLLSFYIFSMCILELFYPEYVGVYMSPIGIPFLGYADAEGFNELLGHWLIPVGLVAVIALQILLNRIIKRWLNHRRTQSRARGT